MWWPESPKKIGWVMCVRLVGMWYPRWGLLPLGSVGLPLLALAIRKCIQHTSV